MMDEAKGQPTAIIIKTTCLLFAGPLLMYRAFKQSGPHSLCGITNSEFSIAINDLEESGLGMARSVCVCFYSNPVTVFVKEDLDKVPWWGQTPAIKPNTIHAITKQQTRIFSLQSSVH